METEPQIIDNYIRTGKARLVYRHLLQLGPGSLALAEASECAGAQGRYWEMRELIYHRQSEVYSTRDFAGVQPLVATLGLDEAQFKQCMDTGEYRAQVEADNAASEKAGVRGRPVLDINGTRIVGTQSYERYRTVLDAAQ